MLLPNTGLELVKIAVVGQSFVLHQIRKMVGLAMAVVRGYATEAMMDASFDRGKVFVPRAPGEENRRRERRRKRGLFFSPPSH